MSAPESPLDLARRMVAAKPNPYAGCGVTAALKDCQTLAAALIEISERVERQTVGNSMWAWNRRIIEEIRAAVPNAPVLDEQLVDVIRGLAEPR